MFQVELNIERVKIKNECSWSPCIMDAGCHEEIDRVHALMLTTKDVARVPMCL